MTADTATQYLAVIHLQHRLPETGGMTVLTDVCGQQVRRRFTRCIYAIVTTDTVSADVPMIERDHTPAGVYMALITLGIRRRMISRLTCRNTAVVATGAGTKHFTVFYIRHSHPVGGDMAGFTVAGRQRMTERAGGVGIKTGSVMTG